MKKEKEILHENNDIIAFSKKKLSYTDYSFEFFEYFS